MSKLPYIQIMPNSAQSALFPDDVHLKPVMLSHLEEIDVITLDAAVSTGVARERAQRLLTNRSRVAPDRLPILIVTAHNDGEYRWAQEAAQRLSQLVASVHVVNESGRNETAPNALSFHRRLWPEMEDRERKG